MASSRRCGAGLSLVAAVLCSVLLPSLNIYGVKVGKDGIEANAAHDERVSRDQVNI